jgi:hypothetical protein
LNSICITKLENSNQNFQIFIGRTWPLIAVGKSKHRNAQKAKNECCSFLHNTGEAASHACTGNELWDLQVKGRKHILLVFNAFGGRSSESLVCR